MNGYGFGALLCALLLGCAACTPTRNTIKPPYQVGGTTYDASQLQRYAAAKCSRQPPHPFTTDGCSLWPDGAWRSCCIEHDTQYWCGGDPTGRNKADEQLRACVQDRSNWLNADLVYLGVRIGGARWWPFPWRWGYGYNWLNDAGTAAARSE